MIREYVGYFNEAHSHQGIQQTIPAKFGSGVTEKREGKIIAFPILNGLHNYYRRAA